MPLLIVPYTERETPAARAFNQRMREKGAASEFLLPESPPPDVKAAVRTVYHLAVDGEFVRGGFVLSEYASWLAGREITAVNCIAPLSEGIVDPNHAFVAMQIVKTIQQRSPYAFSVGMGGEENPYPRLLKAAGWSIQPVPFFFWALRANRVLRELQMLRTSPMRRFLSSLATTTGA
jgi:hypothetical protein